MNILYIGEETRNWIVILANEMSLLDHIITIVVKKYDEYDDENKTEPLENVTVIEVDDEAFFNNELMITTIGDERLKTFDIVYGSHIIACSPVVAIGKQYKIPYGTQVLDVPLDLMRIQEFRMNNWRMYVKLLKDVTAMTFITKKARDDWARLAGKYYTDEHIITYAATVPEKYKNSGTDLKGDYIISTCRLSPVKNISMITRAIGLIDRPIKQVVIGRDNGDLATIMKIAKIDGTKIIYKDTVSEEEKFELIKNSLCVVYPQQTEYIGGLNPWEGMMFGKPVLCTDYKILRDLYKDHIDYFDRASTWALADKITKIYDNKYNKDKLAVASTYAYKDASFKTMARKLLYIFHLMRKKK